MAITLTDGSSYPQLLERLEEAGKGLVDAARIGDLHPGYPQAHEGERHGHPMVLIGLDAGRAKRSGADDEAVGLLLGLDSQPVELGHDGGDAIALLGPDEADAR